MAARERRACARRAMRARDGPHRDASRGRGRRRRHLVGGPRRHAHRVAGERLEVDEARVALHRALLRRRRLERHEPRLGRLLGLGPLLALEELRRLHHVGAQLDLGLGVEDRVLHPEEDRVELVRIEAFEVAQLLADVAAERIERLAVLAVERHAAAEHAARGGRGADDGQAHAQRLRA
eukprot:5327840-Prymnesium_polylepis.1